MRMPNDRAGKKGEKKRAVQYINLPLSYRQKHGGEEGNRREGKGSRRGRLTWNLCPRVWFMTRVAASTHMNTRMKPFIRASAASVPSIPTSPRSSGAAMVELDLCVLCRGEGGGVVRRHAYGAGESRRCRSNSKVVLGEGKKRVGIGI